MLHKLAGGRLLVGERIEQEDRPDKRVFTLTESGTQTLQSWLDQPDNFQVGRSALFLHFLVLALVRPKARAPDTPAAPSPAGVSGRLVADRATYEVSDNLATRGLREAAILHVEAHLKWVEWLESLDDNDVRLTDVQR